MRGQGSVEYFTILTAILVVFAAVTITQMVDLSSGAARETEQLAQARGASDKIANAINGVYAQDSKSAVLTEFVYLSRPWSLKLNPENLRIGIEIDGELKWVGSSLKYGFNNQISDIPSGGYTVIVEWSNDETETVNLNSEDQKIYIYINPTGGS